MEPQERQEPRKQVLRTLGLPQELLPQARLAGVGVEEHRIADGNARIGRAFGAWQIGDRPGFEEQDLCYYCKIKIDDRTEENIIAWRNEIHELTGIDPHTLPLDLTADERRALARACYMLLGIDIDGDARYEQAIERGEVDTVSVPCVPADPHRN